MARVLVVDDSKAMRHYIAAGLDPFFSVEISSDGQDALDRLETSPFDLVVSDLEMPRMSGLDLFQALRDLEIHVPLVLVTDQEIERWLGTARELGLGHIFPKHMLHADFEGLVRLLSSLLPGGIRTGLPLYLSPGGEVRTFVLSDPAEVPPLLERTHPILAHYPRASIYKAVLGLLIQHGLSFGAPRGGFRPGGYLQVSVGADSRRVGMAVRDPAGGLDRATVLEWMSHPQVEGSRGWGIQVLRRCMDQCYVSLEPSGWTEVVCLDLLEGYEGPHLLSVEES